MKRTLLLSLALLAALPAMARELNIGYLDLADDPRYDATRLERRFQGQPWGRPLAGAEVAVEESSFAAEALDLTLKLETAEADDADGLGAALDELLAHGARFVLVDLPAPALAQLAAATRGRGVTLINVGASADALRGAQCQPHLLHTAASESMLADALGQYLVSRKWRKVLALVGPLPADRERMDAFARSAKRYGLKIVAERPFKLSNDPRERDLGNIGLLTAGEDYDAVYIADSDGEFARDAQFRTVLPRPVVGSAGLVADIWQWGWERNGAPQLNNRFRKSAKREMSGADWAAWVAVKGVVEASLRVADGDDAAVLRYLRGGEIIIDGFKGARLSFRAWDGQLRQPVFLGYGNGVAASAPVDGFLHPTNTLDTLGADERDSTCKF